MAEKEHPAAKVAESPATRSAIVVAICVTFANAAFLALSQLYFDAHKIDAPGVGSFVDEAARTSAREAFAVLSVLVGIAAFIAGRAPREIGHGLAALLGLTNLAGGIAAFDKGMPPVMGVTLLVAGGLMLALSYGSWQKSRPAWAFLIATVVTLGGVTFFGAPKIRGVVGVSLWTALTLPALQVVTIVALAHLRGDYKRA